jgi:hypothetical protein
VLESRKAVFGVSRNPWEAAIGFFRSRAFDALDLETIDRAYEAAWAQLVAREPFRDRVKDANEGRRYGAFSPSPAGARSISTVCATEFWRICPSPGPSLGRMDVAGRLARRGNPGKRPLNARVLDCSDARHRPRYFDLPSPRHGSLSRRGSQIRPWLQHCEQWSVSAFISMTRLEVLMLREAFRLRRSSTPADGPLRGLELERRKNSACPRHGDRGRR